MKAAKIAQAAATTKVLASIVQDLRAMVRGQLE